MADPDKSRSRQPAAKKPAAAPSRSMSRKPEMSESESPQGSVFDTQRISRLVELMKEHDLSEIDLRESRQRIRICRGPQEAPRAAYAPPPTAPAPAPSPPESRTSGGQASESANIVLIKSPMVGTFYSRPNPKAESYVKVGDRVDTSTVVCIIEAMKVFNEIPAEIRGKIVAVLANDGEGVEFDKPLFRVDTSG
jgi:acetyl-CoA carboxylase biotin carboxyl carrier protein